MCVVLLLLPWPGPIDSGISPGFVSGFNGDFYGDFYGISMGFLWESIHVQPTNIRFIGKINGHAMKRAGLYMVTCSGHSQL